MDYKKGKLLTEGKTKKVWEVEGSPDLVIVENKTAITAFDDPSKTKQFEAKARYATTTTCRVFELLKACGLQVAYIKQLSDTEFLAPRVTMIPLEAIVRRYAVGSYLERMPHLRREGRPVRFHRLITEFFLKTTGGKITIKGEQLSLGVPEITTGDNKTKPLDDPLILNAEEDPWRLYMPKKPAWEKGSNLDISFGPNRINISQFDMPILDLLNRRAFLIMEAAWANLGFRLIDWKIEFGRGTDGQLYIADVIDNDSWRLRDPNFTEVSKQAFRDGEKLDAVEAKYGYVAEAVKGFRLPNQALVLWRGSPKDKLSTTVSPAPGIQMVPIELSGHKNTQACLQKLEELQRDFPDGGVIIAIVGMSNGLGPVLASHSAWPVISVSATANERPEDVWSSLRMPSENPAATMLSEGNAVLIAQNILAQKNPAAYMVRQMAIEILDKGY